MNPVYEVVKGLIDDVNNTQEEAIEQTMPSDDEIVYVPCE